MAKVNFLNLKLYVYGLIEIVLINLYFIFYSPNVVAVAEANSEHIYLNANWLVLLFILSLILETASFYYIPFQKKMTKAIFLYFSWIPRLLLFFEIFRHIFFSVVSQQSYENHALLWILLLLVLLVIKELTMIILLTMFNYKGEKLKYNFRVFISRMLFLPAFLLWTTIYKQQIGFLNDGTDMFVFWGLFFVFIYFPFHFQWIVLNFENRKLTIFNVVYFLFEPVFIYLLESKSFF